MADFMDEEAMESDDDNVSDEVEIDNNNKDMTTSTKIHLKNHLDETSLLLSVFSPFYF